MEILKFILSGESAFFKMPEVNSYYYFSYGNIHKVALMGIFGAILGYKGYAQMRKEDEYPEFYEKLHSLEVAIVPKKNSKGYLPKKIQCFNNSVGYASQEQGGNLIVKQQWLEKPWWEIYVKIQDQESEKIKQAICQKTCIYIPYLGSNDHLADIGGIEIIEGTIIEEDEINQIDSLYPEFAAELDDGEDGEDKNKENNGERKGLPFQYTEFLPVGLEKTTHMYQMQKFIFTNSSVISHQSEVYQVNQKNIIFF